MRGMGRVNGLGLGRLGFLADGTPVVGTAAGPQVVSPEVASALQQSPQSNAQIMAIPASAGGGNVQGRGINYQYVTPLIATIADGASTTVTIQFDQNSTFCWLRTTYSVNVSGDAEELSDMILPEVGLVITDTGNGMAFMSGPVPLYCIGGTGQLPYVLPTPQWIQPNASYQYRFNNFSSASTYINLQVQFHGFRVFSSGSPGTGS